MNFILGYYVKSKFFYIWMLVLFIKIFDNVCVVCAGERTFEDKYGKHV